MKLSVAWLIFFAILWMANWEKVQAVVGKVNAAIAMMSGTKNQDNAATK